MRRTAIVCDNRYLLHKTGIHHIEIPQRLETVYKTLQRDSYNERCITIPPRFITLEELETIHSPKYIEKILDTAGESLRYLDPDTVTSEDSCTTAFLAAGGVLEAVKTIVSGDADNCFALVRPPGHHAERNRQMGFCLFNNIALGAEYALRHLGLSRILIVDWDVHHPNGTQHIFEATPNVLLFSSHRYPFFPGSGSTHECGSGAGLGFTINIPLSPNKNDAHFADIYSSLLPPVAYEYQPELILVSAGFDTHRDDPIGGMQVTERGFAYLTELVIDIAENVCNGKVVFVLEGGYDLGAMRKGVKAVLDTSMNGLPPETKKFFESQPASDTAVSDIIKAVHSAQKPYWKCFSRV